jgi:hypothetical protein
MTGAHGPADVTDAKLGKRVSSKQTYFNNSSPSTVRGLPLIWYTFHYNRNQIECEDDSMEYEREVVSLETGVVVLELLQGIQNFADS